MHLRTILRTTTGLTIAAAILGVLMRRPMLDWGATAEEAGRSLPGDELLPDADLIATRAITIDAPPRDVWPWLVQIGNGRAGAYSYDWLEQLAGLDIHSSRQIMPELQNLSLGDVIPVENDGTGLRVHILETDSVLGVRTDDATWSWTWVLQPGNDETRLLSRTRMRTRSSPLLSRVVTNAFMIPASWLMERKMLLGLRERAEGHPPPSPPT